VQCRYDNELERALQRAGAAAGSVTQREQVVVLGAGMDMRPWRHAWLQGGRLGKGFHHRAVHQVSASCVACCATGDATSDVAPAYAEARQQQRR
jgi:Leucine carboxyl methyltransferase